MKEGMERYRNGHTRIIGKARNGHHQRSTHGYLEIFNRGLHSSFSMAVFARFQGRFHFRFRELSSAESQVAVARDYHIRHNRLSNVQGLVGA